MKTNCQTSIAIEDIFVHSAIQAIEAQVIDIIFNIIIFLKKKISYS